MNGVANLFSVVCVCGFFAFIAWLVVDFPKLQALEECRRTHNVYQCEWFAEARPLK